MKTDNKKTITTNLPEFISKVKSQDNLSRMVYMATIVLYFIIIVAHLAFISISIYNNTPFTEWMGYLGTLLPFIIIFYFLNKRHKEYKQADYTLPTYLVLKNMERRYNFLRHDDRWVLITLFFLGISLGKDSPKDFLSFQFEYWTIMIISMLIGYLYWYIKRKPLRDKASQLIKELEE